MGQTQGKALRLASLIACKVGSFPTKYLDLPLSVKTPSKNDWKGLIQKLQSKIDGWQTKLLSRGGRLILVNAVLTNLPLYYLFVFKAPRWVTKRIESLRRDFFWNSGNNTAGRGCLIA